MGIYFVVALRNLLQAKRRTAFLGIALSMVAALLVLLLSLAQGLTDNMIHYATTLASGHVNVAGFYKLSPGDVAPLVLDSPKLREIVEKEVPEATRIIDRNRGWSKLVSESGALWASPTGINPAEEGELKAALKLAPERAYKKDGGDATPGDLSKIGEPGTVLLFASQAKKMEVGVGDQITIVSETMRGATNSAELTVVAVAQDMGMMSQWTVFVPKTTVHELYKMSPDTSGAVMIFLPKIEQTAEVLARLQKKLPELGFTVLDHKSAPFWQKLQDLTNEDWTGARLDLTTWEDEASFLKWVIAAFNGVSFFLVAVLLLIIVIGIMNTMFMSVRERTGEVGTLRAIGMGKWRVLGMFVTEALILGLAASTFGALLGAGIAMGIDAMHITIGSDAARMILLSDIIHVAAQPGHVIGAIVVFTLVTGLSALYPAFRAARMRPVTAIHHVN